MDPSFVAKYKTSFFEDFLGKPKFVSWTKIRDRLSSAEKMRQRKGTETKATPVQENQLELF